MNELDRETLFASVVTEHRDRLYRICCAYVREDADRQDIHQTIVPLFVLCLGGALTVHEAATRHLTERGVQLALAGYAVFFVALCIFAVVVSRRDWYRQHGTVVRDLARLEKELAGD